MEWSQDSCIKLIEVYKAHPVLWNPSDLNYFKKNFKSDAWAEISSKVGVQENECRDKIVSLLSSYRREKSRVKKSTGTGKGKLFIKYVNKLVNNIQIYFSSLIYV